MTFRFDQTCFVVCTDDKTTVSTATSGVLQNLLQQFSADWSLNTGPPTNISVASSVVHGATFFSDFYEEHLSIMIFRVDDRAVKCKGSSGEGHKLALDLNTTQRLQPTGS